MNNQIQNEEKTMPIYELKEGASYIFDGKLIHFENGIVKINDSAGHAEYKDSAEKYDSQTDKITLSSARQENSKASRKELEKQERRRRLGKIVEKVIPETLNIKINNNKKKTKAQFKHFEEFLYGLLQNKRGNQDSDDDEDYDE